MRECLTSVKAKRNYGSVEKEANAKLPIKMSFLGREALTAMRDYVVLLRWKAIGERR